MPAGGNHAVGLAAGNHTGDRLSNQRPTAASVGSANDLPSAASRPGSRRGQKTRRKNRHDGGESYESETGRHARFLSSICLLNSEHSGQTLVAPTGTGTCSNRAKRCGEALLTAPHLQTTVLGGALTGKQNRSYCVGSNPAAGKNCLHFSILVHF